MSCSLCMNSDIILHTKISCIRTIYLIQFIITRIVGINLSIANNYTPRSLGHIPGRFIFLLYGHRKYTTTIVEIGRKDLQILQCLFLRFLSIGICRQNGYAKGNRLFRINFQYTTYQHLVRNRIRAGCRQYLWLFSLYLYLFRLRSFHRGFPVGQCPSCRNIIHAAIPGQISFYLNIRILFVIRINHQPNRRSRSINIVIINPSSSLNCPFSQNSRCIWILRGIRHQQCAFLHCGFHRNLLIGLRKRIYKICGTSCSRDGQHGHP